MAQSSSRTLSADCKAIKGAADRPKLPALAPGAFQRAPQHEAWRSPGTVAPAGLRHAPAHLWHALGMSNMCYALNCFSGAWLGLSLLH